MEEKKMNNFGKMFFERERGFKIVLIIQYIRYSNPTDEIITFVLS